ncbi:hypothetical protein D1872_277700 [compost metagenome]
MEMVDQDHRGGPGMASRTGGNGGICAVRSFFSRSITGNGPAFRTLYLVLAGGLGSFRVGAGTADRKKKRIVVHGRQSDNLHDSGFLYFLLSLAKCSMDRLRRSWLAGQPSLSKFSIEISAGLEKNAQSAA